MENEEMNIIGASQNTAHPAPQLAQTGFSEITNDRILYDGEGFWYCEIAVTGKCSFACTYCNRLKSNIDLNKICFFIDKHKGTLKHIQLTGGEPTEYENISELCRFVKSKQIKLGISTNGSAPLALYEQLNADMYSISLDDYLVDVLEARGYRKIETVIDNIQQLSKITYVNIGVVIDRINVDRIDQILQFILCLGVADIKLSVNTKDEVIPTFVDADYSQYPILNYRVNRFRRGLSMRGMTETDSFPCGLVQNDIAIVSNYHYPCLVYAREGGSPIGSIDGDVEADRLNWYMNTIPNKDPICKKYCMDFKCEFNREHERIHALRSPA